MSKRNVGSSFDEFLAEEGLLQEATAVAVKRYIAYQLQQKMSEENLSKSEMAKRMVLNQRQASGASRQDNRGARAARRTSKRSALGARSGTAAIISPGVSSVGRSL